MKITLTNQHASISAATEQEKLALDSLKAYMSYNDDIAAWQRANLGKKFDVTDPVHVQSMIKFTKRPHYQNWLVYQSSGRYYNPHAWNTRKKRTGKAFNAYQMHDGYVSAIAADDKKGFKVKMRAGLLRYALKFLQKNFPHIQPRIDDLRVNHVLLTPDPIYDIGPFSALPHQRQALDQIRHTLLAPGGMLFSQVLLDLAVNSGKTILLGLLLRNVRNVKALMPFTSQTAHARAVADYIEMGFDVSVVASDMKPIKNELSLRGLEELPDMGYGGELIVAMVQTAISRPLDFAEVSEINVVAVDEADQMTSDSCCRLYDAISPGLQVGMSGTTHGAVSGEARYRLRGLFGAQRFTLTTADNIEAGVSVPPKVRFNRVQHYGIADLSKSAAKEAAYVSESRLEVVANIIRRHEGKPIFIYTGRALLEHHHLLHQYLQETFGEVGNVCGEAGDIADQYDRFRSGQLQLIVANRVAMRGVNLKNIAVLINWEITDNPTSVVQALIGRGVRANAGKDSYILEELADEGNDHLWSAALARRKVYQNPEHGAEIIEDL